jgi:hypothetical protein
MSIYALEISDFRYGDPLAQLGVNFRENMK